MPPLAYVSWSSGKDSTFALLEAQRLGLARIAGILTTVNMRYSRVAMHGVRTAVLDRQIAALGLPLARWGIHPAARPVPARCARLQGVTRAPPVPARNCYAYMIAARGGTP